MAQSSVLEGVLVKYNCKTVTYGDNDLETFAAKCVPYEWRKFFGRKDIKEDLRDINAVILKELNRPWPKHPGIEPRMPLLFEAFNRVDPQDIKVVILGQDPTPQEDKATGLAFSVEKARSVGTVLNILIEAALEGFNVNLDNGDLTYWANQGVLLLNAALTVESGGKPRSHTQWWGYFTTELVKYISKTSKEPCVWFLWGNDAKSYKEHIGKRHFVMEGSHPSNLGAVGKDNEFFGKNYFQCANEFLTKGTKQDPIDWNLYPENHALESCPSLKRKGKPLNNQGRKKVKKDK